MKHHARQNSSLQDTGLHTGKANKPNLLTKHLQQAHQDDNQIHTQTSVIFSKVDSVPTKECTTLGTCVAHLLKQVCLVLHSIALQLRSSCAYRNKYYKHIHCKYVQSNITQIQPRIEITHNYKKEISNMQLRKKQEYLEIALLTQQVLHHQYVI